MCIWPVTMTYSPVSMNHFHHFLAVTPVWKMSGAVTEWGPNVCLCVTDRNGNEQCNDQPLLPAADEVGPTSTDDSHSPEAVKIWNVLHGSVWCLHCISRSSILFVYHLVCVLVLNVISCFMVYILWQLCLLTVCFCDLSSVYIEDHLYHMCECV